MIQLSTGQFCASDSCIMLDISFVYDNVCSWFGSSERNILMQVNCSFTTIEQRTALRKDNSIDFPEAFVFKAVKSFVGAERRLNTHASWSDTSARMNRTGLELERL